MEQIKKFEQNLISKEIKSSNNLYNNHKNNNSNNASSQSSIDNVSSDESEPDIDELLADIDDKEIFNRYREQRLQEISEHLKQVEKNVKFESYGQLETIEEEAKLIKLSNETKKIIIHFQLENFQKCKTMNEKLWEVSREYLDVKFVKINVDKCPFLVSKLNIKVLPFVIGYINGVEKLRLVGFSRLGNVANDFELDALKVQLEDTGFI